MAKRIIWTGRAKFELKEILDYWNLRTGSKRYSKKLTVQFNDTIKNIAGQSYIGRQTDTNDVRGIVCGNYLLFYRLANQSVFVVTIFDSRRNPSDLNYDDLPE